MEFTNYEKQKALAIVRVFETGKAEGEPAAVAVLDDGAGVSYGINQFTHRSGALLAVIERYFELGGTVGRAVIQRRLGLLRKPSRPNIKKLAADNVFKKALRAAAISGEMKKAQAEIAEERFLQPAIGECERLGFVTALALAVVFDSITHGSWAKIRDRIGSADVAETSPKPSTLVFEKAWITEYVRRRDAWLASIPRLGVTRYRTRFFLNQIAIGNWELTLPLKAHGVTIDKLFFAACGDAGEEVRSLIPAVGPNLHTTNNASDTPQTDAGVSVEDPSHHRSSDQPQAQPPGSMDDIEAQVNAIAANYDRIERVVTTVIERTDRAKSLWATFVGTVWQTVWAIFGWLANIPREVWLVVAVIAGALTLLYLYRQIELGRIREMRID